MPDITVQSHVDDLMASATKADARAAIEAAPLASPALTGVPTAPTAAGGTDTTQIATTEFVQQELAGVVQVLEGEVATFADLPAAGAGNNGHSYLVRQSTGVYFVNRKKAGIYTSDGATWELDGDATEAYFQDTLAWTNITSKPSAASQAEMEAGAEAAIRLMSPERVAQAIAALAVAAPDVLWWAFGRGQVSLAFARAVGGTSPALAGTTHTASGTGSANAGSSSQPQMVNYVTAASLNADAGPTYGAFSFHRWGPKLDFSATIRIPTLTNIRAWVGMTTGSLANQNASDSPAFNFTMWRFSSATDTNWMLCGKDGSTLATADSGIAPTTGLITLGWRFVSATSLQGYINGVAVGSPVTTNLPAVGTMGHLIISIRTTEAVAKDIRVSQMAIIEFP